MTEGKRVGKGGARPTSRGLVIARTVHAWQGGVVARHMHALPRHSAGSVS